MTKYDPSSHPSWFSTLFGHKRIDTFEIAKDGQNWEETETTDLQVMYGYNNEDGTPLHEIFIGWDDEESEWVVEAASHVYAATKSGAPITISPRLTVKCAVDWYDAMRVALEQAHHVQKDQARRAEMAAEGIMKTYQYYGEPSREDLWDKFDWAIMAAAARKPGRVTLKDMCQRFNVGKCCIQKRASRLRQAGLLVPRVSTFQLTRDGAWRWRKTGKWMNYTVFEQHLKPWFDKKREERKKRREQERNHV